MHASNGRRCREKFMDGRKPRGGDRMKAVSYRFNEYDIGGGMAQSIVKKTRRYRHVSAVSVTYLLMFLGLLAPVISLILGIVRTAPIEAQSPLATSPMPSAMSFPGLVPLLILALLIALAFIILQARLEYRRKTYDPTWIFKFDERFKGMRQERLNASQLLLNDISTPASLDDAELAKIDDVLDFFEDLGFYQHGYQISPEVIHHHFYHWIRGYWSAARTYVERSRRDERKAWEHLEELFETGCDIETRDGGTRERELLDREEIKDFLSNEIDECKNDE